MSHQKIIQDLIAWIDEHIDQPLNIDVVAKKSGYSKWYLQRMFRTVTHQTLGDYIRQRRLLLAAVELRTTGALFLISRWIWVTFHSRPFPAFSVGNLIALPAITATGSRVTARAWRHARVIALPMP